MLKSESYGTVQRKCHKCGEYTSRFILCRECNRKVCMNCAFSPNYCRDCYLEKYPAALQQEYQDDKMMSPAAAGEHAQDRHDGPDTSGEVQP